MSDEDAPYIPMMGPAIPSRATGELKPLEPLPEIPRRAPQLRLPKPRVKPRKKVKKMARKPTTARRSAAPKNPNRPLELKNQIHALLDVVKHLEPTDLKVFASTMETLRALSKPARARVLGALNKVYG
jgi:hypothetical protein